MTSWVKQLKHLVTLVLTCLLKILVHQLEEMTLRGTVEASRHPFSDLPVGKVTQSFGKDDLSGETIEASCHVCADLLVEDVVPSSGEDDLSGETVFPLVKYPVSWLDPGTHTKSPSDVGDEKMTTISSVGGGEAPADKVVGLTRDHRRCRRDAFQFVGETRRCSTTWRERPFR